MFRSNAFNTTAAREYFINPECFGDDLAGWLISELRANGYDTDEEPGQEDFGWYFTFEVAGNVIALLCHPARNPRDWQRSRYKIETS